MNTRPASSPAEHNSLVVNGAAVEAQLRELLQKRILILDGATGTMIQQYKLTEAQYRGERFADFHRDIKGNNELDDLYLADFLGEIKAYYNIGAITLDSVASNPQQLLDQLKTFDLRNLQFQKPLSFIHRQIRKHLIISDPFTFS